jgi:hypothetical protein
VALTHHLHQECAGLHPWHCFNLPLLRLPGLPSSQQPSFAHPHVWPRPPRRPADFGSVTAGTDPRFKALDTEVGPQGLNKGGRGADWHSRYEHETHEPSLSDITHSPCLIIPQGYRYALYALQPDGQTLLVAASEKRPPPPPVSVQAIAHVQSRCVPGFVDDGGCLHRG